MPPLCGSAAASLALLQTAQVQVLSYPASSDLCMLNNDFFCYTCLLLRAWVLSRLYDCESTIWPDMDPVSSKSSSLEKFEHRLQNHEQLIVASASHRGSPPKIVSVSRPDSVANPLRHLLLLQRLTWHRPSFQTLQSHVWGHLSITTDILRHAVHLSRTVLYCSPCNPSPLTT